MDADLDVGFTQVEQPTDLPVGKGAGGQEGDQLPVRVVEPADGGQYPVQFLAVDQLVLRVAARISGFPFRQGAGPPPAQGVETGVAGDGEQEPGLLAVAAVAA